jgi:hypothetical protein
MTARVRGPPLVVVPCAASIARHYRRAIIARISGAEMSVRRSCSGRA